MAEGTSVVAIVAGASVSAVAVVWQAVQFIMTRRSDLKNREFEAYHRLIKELVDPGEKATYVDRQCAVLFELRRFRQYREVSIRILEGLREDWDLSKYHPRLGRELDLTLASLRGRRS